jgi:hypothetical protein
MLINTKIGVNTPSASYLFQMNCIIYKPDNYDATKKYPLILFGHGSGEAGTDISVMYNQGLPAALKGGFVPPFDCIIVCVQSTSYGVQPLWLPTILTTIKSQYPIDPTKIYLTGLSSGGMMCYGAVLNVDPNFGSNFAGMVVLSGATQDATMANIAWWKKNPVPVLAISGTLDDSFTAASQSIVTAINGQVPGLASFVPNPGQGHGGWVEIYNNTWGGIDIWKWMASHVLGSAIVTTPPPVVVLPTAPRTVTAVQININGTLTNIPVSGCKFSFSDGGTQ